MLSVALEKSNWPCLRNIRRGKFIWIFVHSAAQELHFWVVGYSRHGLLVFLCFLSFLLNNCFVRLVSIEPSNFLCQSKEWGTFLCYVRILLFIRHYTFHLASCKQFRCIPFLGGLAGCAGVSFVFWIWKLGELGVGWPGSDERFSGQNDELFTPFCLSALLLFACLLP